MADFPPDRFDELPNDLQRRGAHRAPPRRGRGWIALLWAVIAVAILIAAGLTVLSLLTNEDSASRSSYVSSPTASPSATPTAQAKLDPEIPLTIVNGTTTARLANHIGDELVKEGWKGAALGVGSRLTASTPDVDKTVVYYADPSEEGAARALVAALKVGAVQLSDDYPGSPITIVVGSDYQPKG
jgi:hypothetical protein